MSLDTSKTVKKITYNGVAFMQEGTSNIINNIIDGTITEVNTETLSGVESIRNNAFSGMKIETVSVPSNVTIIGDSAFANNEISSLTLNEGITTIGASAFANNPITTLTIPNSVTTIGDSAFGGTQITELDMSNQSNPPSVTSTTFPSTLTTIHVAYGDYDTYVSAWSDYADKIVRGLAIPSTITVTVNNYLGEMVSGASVTITGNGQTYTGATNESGVFTQGDLQPATYTISVAVLDGFGTPESQEVVVEEDTQNSVTITYLEQTSGAVTFASATPQEVQTIANDISTKGMTIAEMEATYGWKVGDTKDITLTTGEVIQMRIIGVNHDTLSSGLGTAGLTLEMVNSLNKEYSMNSTTTNENGYLKSNMKTSYLPTIKTTLPQGWQDVIVMVDKKSANGGGINYTETVTASEDLFLLSEIEVFGTVTNAQDGVNEGSVYEYWNGKGDADRIKKLEDTATGWWLRSAPATLANSFCRVFKTGITNTAAASAKMGVSFAFCVGSVQPSRIFGENTAQMISEISKEISAKNMTSAQVEETYGWKLGDTLAHTMTNGEQIQLQIIGFNHDDKADGTGKAGITLQTVNCLSNFSAQMFSTNANAGGWEISYMKNYLDNTIKPRLQSWLWLLILEVNKKYAAGGTSATIGTSKDTLFLLSEAELFSYPTKAQIGTSEGTQYEYWVGKSDADRVKNLNGTSSSFPWWLRSCAAGNVNKMVYVGQTGGVATDYSSTVKGISFAFCI